MIEELTDYNIISGKIANFLPVSENISDYDQLLVSRKQLDAAKPSWYFSRKIAYSDFSKSVYQSISSKYSFNSMAYEESSDYAPIDHVHPYYNKISCYFPYDGNDPDNIPIAKIKIDDEIYTIGAPKPVYPQLRQPSPGEIKMRAPATNGSNESRINVNSPDFDGWVYADGSEYPKSQFEYSDKFDEGSSRDYFRVPNLTEFLYIDNTQTQSVGDEIFPAENEMARHNHTFPLKMTGQISGNVTYWYGGVDTASTGGDTGTHGANNPPDGETSINMSMSIKDLTFNFGGKTRPVTSNGKHTHPSYMYIPFLIYIGKKKSS